MKNFMIVVNKNDTKFFAWLAAGIIALGAVLGVGFIGNFGSSNLKNQEAGLSANEDIGPEVLEAFNAQVRSCAKTSLGVIQIDGAEIERSEVERFERKAIGHSLTGSIETSDSHSIDSLNPDQIVRASLTTIYNKHRNIESVAIRTIHDGHPATYSDRALARITFKLDPQHGQTWRSGRTEGDQRDPHVPWVKDAAQTIEHTFMQCMEMHNRYYDKDKDETYRILSNNRPTDAAVYVGAYPVIK